MESYELTYEWKFGFINGSERTLRNEEKRFKGELLIVLGSFEKAKDWADLSSCLTRLQKLLSRPWPSVTKLPCSDLVSKRLGQCLSPTLPAGVHSKSLEIYRLIFVRIGPNNLASELGLWTLGLFPLFRFGAIFIQPIFLDLIDEFFIPLGSQLKPCLTGILVSLLSGMDIVSEERHTRVMHLFRTIALDCVGMSAFMFSLWSVLNRTAAVRLSAIHVLVSFIGEVQIQDATQETLNIYLPETSYHLIPKTFERLLKDNDVLVRREFFDFVVSNLPLNSNYYILRNEKVFLLRASFAIIQSMEWSLHRRFLQWITGETSNFSDANFDFFNEHVCDALCSAIQEELSQLSQSDQNKDQFFFFNLLNLLQNNAPPLVTILLEKVTAALWDYILSIKKCYREHHIQCIRVILEKNPLFLQAAWRSLYQTIHNEHDKMEECEIFIREINIFVNFWDEQYARDNGFVTMTSPCRNEASQHIQYVTGHCLNVLLLMFSNNVEPYAETVGVDLVHITLQAISRLHQCQIRTKNNFFFNVAKAFYNDIEKSTTYCMNIEKESTQTMIFKELNHILKILWHVCVSEVATSQEEDYEDLSNSLLSSFFLLAKKCLDQVALEDDVNWYPLHIFVSLCSESEILRSTFSSPHSSHYVEFCEIMNGVWNHLLKGCDVLNSSTGQENLGKLLLSLHDIERKECERRGGTLIRLLVSNLSSSSVTVKIFALRKFVLLWNHSITLNWSCHETIFSEVIRLVLECLDSSDTTLCALSKSWLREACDTHLCCLLDPLYEDLITLQPQYSFVQVDTERILYLMNLLSSVFSVDSCRLLSFMSKHTISSSLQQLCSNFHRQNDMYIHVEPLIEKNHDNPGIGLFGYDDANCIIDYMDLTCVTVLQCMNIGPSQSSSSQPFNQRLISSGIQLLSKIVTGLESFQQEKCKVCLFLLPPFIRLVQVFFDEKNYEFLIQTTYLLMPLIPWIWSYKQSQYVLSLKDKTIDEYFGSMLYRNLSSTQTTQFQDVPYKTTYSMLMQQETIIERSHDALLDFAESFLTFPFSQENSYDIFFMSMDAFIQFSLVVLRCLSKYYSNLVTYHERCLLTFLKSFLQTSLSNHLLHTWYLFRASHEYIFFLCQISVKEHAIVQPECEKNTQWPSLYSFLTKSFQAPMPLTNQDQTILTLLQTHLLHILGSMIMILEQLDHVTYETSLQLFLHLVKNHIPTTSGMSQQKLLSKFFELVQNKPIHNRHSTLSHILLYTVAVFTMLFEKLPERTTLVLLLLMQLEETKSAASKFLSILIQVDTTGDIYIRQLLTLITTNIFKESATHTTSVLPNTFKSALAEEIYVSEDCVMKFFFSLSQNIIQSKLNSMTQVMYSNTFILLDLVVYSSKHSLTFLWMLTILTQLHETFESDTINDDLTNDIKSHERALTELISKIVNLATLKEITLLNGKIIDMCRYPPQSLLLLNILFTENIETSEESSDEPVKTSEDTSTGFFNSMQQIAKFYTFCTDSAFSALVALSELIAFNTCSHTSKQLCCLCTIIFKDLTKKHWNQLYKSICSKGHPLKLEVRYLGLLQLVSLPYSLVPACSATVRKITYDIIYSNINDCALFPNLFLNTPQNQKSTDFSDVAYDRRSCRALMKLVNIAAKLDTQYILDMGYLLTSHRQSSMFSFRETEIFRRISDLKKLSFMLLSCSKNFFNSYLGAISSRIIEALHIEKHIQFSNSFTNLIKIQAFLCFRVLCYKTSFGLLNSLWPIVLTEMIQIFSLPIVTDNYAMILAILKLIDFAILWDIPELHMHHWVFIDDGRRNFINCKQLENQEETNQPNHFVSLCDQLSQQETNETETDNYNTFSSHCRLETMRKPLITESSVSCLQELKAIASRLNQNSMTHYFATLQVDEEAVVRSFENDFLEASPELFDKYTTDILPSISSD